MHKLTVLPSSPMVDDLLNRLQAEGIEATWVSERTIIEITAGTAPSVAVLISDESKKERAEAIVEEMKASRTSPRCPHCSYDLRGHDGETVCPECGKDVQTAPADVPCPICGEPVPGDFEMCWSCGSDMSDPA